MIKCPLLKSPASLTALCLTVLFPFVAHAAPVPSQPTANPGVLSLSLSANSFATLNGRLYLSDLRSSSFPVSQTYPESSDGLSYGSTPVSLRLSPSIVILFDGWLRLIRLDLEYSIRNNIQGASDSREQNRPNPIRRPSYWVGAILLAAVTCALNVVTD